ncbi:MULTISPECIES: 1,2-phenylacetyl-CoA epoxidase subunit PaaD [Bordetella]|uniref:Phenylacetate-CoA oxygenase subunit PaaJ n=1 Tax=Bordetella genomosp. 6 TaxID=463024 RepID=A0ABX4FIW4_9BORD|nr:MULTISPECIES: 1,2-phenylacetyl-CoA epoxidase subunit PaaD [Bordetella]AOB27703.1 phenylacetate-CoA oxygenase subunit PaaJ [Bordetella bronchiseptica]AZW45028.1 phenylacetate-CoA oxygenase subunit PaaJ [Bordetella bronchiseptica]KCV65781.1 phenylacetate-CoA oxygenase, PaaJ subunit [Bordetella bronchiseptica 99-R-0433]MBN3265996.1 phenylacetate-CoA oxygenase subunit PaaJ [Bordetella bronchiseptica]OZI81457.1 phenylacetate-CoA oxygenase subunit PaaJ [Bordetella genomosp. 6]
MNALPRVPAGQVLAWLESVPDPEIPVLSVVDLGVVRDIGWDGDTCVVTITPTYSGCPAMREITHDIETTLASHGLASVRVETRLAPAWTTDWMSARGRAALRQYGIAAPVERAVDISGISRRRAAPAIECPHCGSLDTRLISHFGSTSCKALYRCVACREPFDYFKPH